MSTKAILELIEMTRPWREGAGAAALAEVVAIEAARGTTPKAEFTREAVEGFTGCQNDRERVCYGAGYDKGLASMKGACWEAVQGQLQACGIFAGSPTWSVIKAAINGASP